MNHSLTEPDLKGLHSTATYPRNAGHDLFTITRPGEQDIAPTLLVMEATGAAQSELREINRRTEVGARRTDEGLERIDRLLGDVRLYGTKFEF